MADQEEELDFVEKYKLSLKKDSDRLKKKLAEGKLEAEEIVKTVLPAIADLADLVGELFEELDDRLGTVEQATELGSMLLPEDAELFANVIEAYRATLQAAPRSNETQAMIRLATEALDRIEEITVEDADGDDDDSEDDEEEGQH